MVYVLKRDTDPRGGYVTPSGSQRSYTQKLQEARSFATREQAEAARCRDNEVVVDVAAEMARELQ